MSDDLTDRQQGFLDMLAARAAGRETAPADPTPAQAGTDPAGGAPEELADPGAPPAPAEMVHVEATESWETDPERQPPAQLMDIGADAQAQGHAMALQTVASRLASVVHDLGALEYFDQATSLLPTMEWAAQEHSRIMGELEQRGQERRGEEE